MPALGIGQRVESNFLKQMLLKKGEEASINVFIFGGAVNSNNKE